jgi:hypothetical protein
LNLDDGQFKVGSKHNRFDNINWQLHNNVSGLLQKLWSWLHWRNECLDHGGMAAECGSMAEIAPQDTKIIGSLVKTTH